MVLVLVFLMSIAEGLPTFLFPLKPPPGPRTPQPGPQPISKITTFAQ